MRGMRAPLRVGRDGNGGIHGVIPRQIRIKRTPDDLSHGQLFLIASFFQLPLLPLGDIDVNSFFGHFSFSFLTCTDIMMYNNCISRRRMQEAMLIYEYKLDGNKQQYASIDTAIRVVQFIRNKCLRLWMDERGITANDLQCYCAVLAKEYSFASRLNSQARQASADRAWFAISRFYENCKSHKPGKKGYPTFQHDNRSVEYKTTGWKLQDDGRHIRFTD